MPRSRKQRSMLSFWSIVFLPGGESGPRISASLHFLFQSVHGSGPHLWRVADASVRSWSRFFFWHNRSRFLSEFFSRSCEEKRTYLYFIIFFPPAASANRMWGCWDAVTSPRPLLIRAGCRAASPRRRPCPIMVAADIRLVGQHR